MKEANMQNGTFRRSLGPTKLGALLLAASGLLAGCGGSSTSTPKGEAFLGLWEIDSTTSSFNLACTGGPVGNVPGAGVWFELNFEEGVLTDVSETSGQCPPQGFGFNVTGPAVLSAPATDPYTGMAPACLLNLGPAPTTNLATFLELDFSEVTFTLLAEVKGKAPQGSLSGMATGTVLQDDGTGNIGSVGTCTYAGSGDIFHRMSK
jgi:hypothetical protein